MITSKDPNRLDFEEAQVIWTQWCRDKFCNMLRMHSEFKVDF